MQELIEYNTNMKKNVRKVINLTEEFEDGLKDIGMMYALKPKSALWNRRSFKGEMILMSQWEHMDYEKERLLFKHPLNLIIGSGCMVSERVPFLPNFGSYLVPISLDYFTFLPQKDMLKDKKVPVFKIFDASLNKWSSVTVIEVYHKKVLKYALCVHELPDPKTGDTIAMIKYELNIPEDINNGHVMPTSDCLGCFYT